MNIFITGASGGLGKALAEKAYSLGHRIFLTDINEKALKEFVSRWKGDKDRVLWAKHDVSSSSDWKKNMDLVFKKWGRLDILMNVAGYLLPGYIYDVSPKDIDRHMDINAKGLMYGTREAAVRMVSQGDGQIINIASLAGVAPIAGISLYSTSKFAARGFSLAVAQDLRPKNVYVSVVCPDAIQTPMLDLQKDYEEASMTFSGNAYLTTETVTDIIFNKVIPNKTLEVLIPGSRGLLAKIGSFLPALNMLLTPSLQNKGRKKQGTYVKN
ncbi:SDR family oxidoreductase [Leptospira wolffii]|uniref:3-ketoacyl-ACP reductase n=1 Tax=Leptospira wolffii TaxID=409998 RepID=A0A2M9ZBT0_9LEPT|nr:SDR family oxidoreductase [Leptospira wolffii]PJZ65905.1 3-ketoacyl-ACP reductase [Leptospira wolffii]TGK59374.1 SDR family oxidoreductase [Leptospira wolffii]TGK71243.1 SDR family oxidoreductase [Leptospira wolffii]TGK77810.1 SDR family oxidoreductase [Leptospira wolffii]TGL29479.1 SDR family oxidoreductase [Leptospira wolffii]